MSKFMNHRIRIIALVIMMLVLATATYGFAASNTVPATAAGEGEGAITGYTVSNVDYTLDASNPLLFTQLSFDITPTPAVVRVGLRDSGATVHWFAPGDCSVGATVTCSSSPFPVTVYEASSLYVVATD